MMSLLTKEITMTVSKATQTSTADELTKFKDYVFALFGLAIVLGLPTFITWDLAPDTWKYPIAYSIIDNVDIKHVYFTKEPEDCDWGHAPMGDKGCHYRKQITEGKNESGMITDVFVDWERVQN